MKNEMNKFIARQKNRNNKNKDYLLSLIRGL